MWNICVPTFSKPAAHLFVSQLHVRGNMLRGGKRSVVRAREMNVRLLPAILQIRWSCALELCGACCEFTNGLRRCPPAEAFMRDERECHEVLDLDFQRKTRNKPMPLSSLCNVSTVGCCCLSMMLVMDCCI